MGENSIGFEVSGGMLAATVKIGLAVILVDAVVPVGRGGAAILLPLAFEVAAVNFSQRDRRICSWCPAGVAHTGDLGGHVEAGVGDGPAQPCGQVAVGVAGITGYTENTISLCFISIYFYCAGCRQAVAQ